MSRPSRDVAATGLLLVLMVAALLAYAGWVAPPSWAQIAAGTMNVNCRATTGAPSYTTATNVPCSQDTSGNARVIISGTVPVSGTITANQGTAGSAWPVSFGGNGTVLSGQQAVTASAVALATNSAKTVCVHALAGNTLAVYLGPSGITTATGHEQSPGDSWCGPVSNTNLLFVIASGTGSSVSWIATN